VTTIQPPAGFTAVVPLDRQKHAGLGINTTNHRWASQLNAVFVGAAEIFKAASDYPIAFAKDPNSDEYVTVALLGLESQQNLFVNADGQWRSLTYIPSYIRRFPFCIAVLDAESRQPQKLVCVQADQLVANGQPFFDANGQPQARWHSTLALLEAIETARLQSRVLSRRLQALDLLVPFDALILPRHGQQRRLQGLYRVDESRLNKIAARDLRTMMRKGELRVIYAHLNSLENFAKLMDLANQ
jgi:hypothetical protein